MRARVIAIDLSFPDGGWGAILDGDRLAEFLTVLASLQQDECADWQIHRGARMEDDESFFEPQQ